MCLGAMAGLAGAGAGGALGGLSTALSAVGALVQGLASYQAAQAQAASMEANAKIAEQNAAQAKINAEMSRKAGQLAQEDAAAEERRLRQEGHQFAGQQRSLLGASGVASGYGSGTSLLMDTFAGIEADAAVIRRSGNRQAWGQEVQAVNYGNQADSYTMQAQSFRSQAKAARQGGFFGLLGGAIGAGSSILSAPKVASSWYSKSSYGATSLIHTDRRLGR